ncbi:MAG TPA: serine kinase [Albitalea sp.]|uniref:serine kinase n=1 Tax=Piscinibacter sp. TaxID=1903157 RepID=UPI002ED495F6
MTKQWKRLVDLHARHEEAAREALARERAAAQAGRVQAQRAQERLQQEIADKAALWQQAAAPAAGERCDVARLRDAGAWSVALDRQIAAAGRDAADAEREAVRRDGELDAGRRRWAEAQAGAERVRRMQERIAAEQRRRDSVRGDEAAEEAALQAWALRRAAWGR